MALRNNTWSLVPLHEEVFISQPPSYENAESPKLVCKLHKAIYGLKQAPKTWFDKLLHTTLLSLQFEELRADQSLFIYISSTHTMFILVYVDDILITGSSISHIQQLNQHLSSVFCTQRPWRNPLLSGYSDYT